MALIPRELFSSRGRRDDLFDGFFRALSRQMDADEAGSEPAVEVSETDGEVQVKMAVPGVDKDKLTIDVADEVLTVRGEMQQEHEEKRKDYHRREIRYGAFQRTVPLPAEVDASKATARLKNGMLEVVAPKSQHAKAHRVKVAVS